MSTSVQLKIEYISRQIGNSKSYNNGGDRP